MTLFYDGWVLLMFMLEVGVKMFLDFNQRDPDFTKLKRWQLLKS